MRIVEFVGSRKSEGYSNAEGNLLIRLVEERARHFDQLQEVTIVFEDQRTLASLDTMCVVLLLPAKDEGDRAEALGFRREACHCTSNDLSKVENMRAQIED